MDKNRTNWLQRRRRIFEIIEVGTSGDWISRGYDIISTLVLLTNLAVTVLYTFDKMELQFGPTLLFLEAVTVAFFAVDYVLRLFTAQFLYPNRSESQALA